MADSHNQVQVPADVRLRTYNDGIYAFDYPENGLFAEFNYENSVRVVRLVVPLDTVTVSFDVRQQLLQNQSAYELAKEFYATSDTRFDDTDNIPPYPITVFGIEAWRSRKRFVDGASAPLIIDTVFLETAKNLYDLSFSSYLSLFYETKWIFDLIIQTFVLLE